MAHTSGKFDIITEDIFTAKVNNIIMSMKNIHKCMISPIRKWYQQVLIKFCKGEYTGYDKPEDVIFEQMIQVLKLSSNELRVCNEMSVRNLIAAHRGYQNKLKEFQKSLKNYCIKLGYI